MIRAKYFRRSALSIGLSIDRLPGSSGTNPDSVVSSAPAQYNPAGTYHGFINRRRLAVGSEYH